MEKRTIIIKILITLSKQYKHNNGYNNIRIVQCLTFSPFLLF